MNALSLQSASNLQKELLAMSVAAAASLSSNKEAESTSSKTKKGKSLNRQNSFQQSKLFPQHLVSSSSRASEQSYDFSNSLALTPSKSKLKDIHEFG
jgi:hypothetical protein